MKMALILEKGTSELHKGKSPPEYPKCVFGAFQAKQIFHDFLKKGMRPNIRCIKSSD